MTKPYGRKIKQKVGEILLKSHRETAMEMLIQIPDKQLVGHLFSYFYHINERVKFRSIAAMGVLGARMEQRNMEKARIVLRRMMWNLNDESGGIGWGSPEAMGEILCQSPKLALEFKSILFSYLDPDGNYIEHEALQRGVLWGIGTYLLSTPQDLDKKTKEILFGYLHSLDPVKRGYAVRALINARCFNYSRVPETLIKDTNQINIFNGWGFISTRISDLLTTRKHCEIVS